MAKHRERILAVLALYGLSYTPAENEQELTNIFQVSKSLKNREDKEEKGDFCSEGDVIEAKRPEGFAWRLTRGVWERQKELNGVIDRLSRHWSLERIGHMERILLQLALFEIIQMRTHPKIVISESMMLADEFGAGKAKNFINGILDTAGREFSKMGEA